MFAGNWSGKIEYLYVDLGSISNSVVLPTAGGFPLGANVHQPRDRQHHPRRHQLSLLGRPELLLIGSARGEAQQAPGRCSGLLALALRRGFCNSRRFPFPAIMPRPAAA